MKKRDAPELYAIIGGKASKDFEERAQIGKAREQYMRVEGARAAAWLVGTHRQKFHMRGALDFFLRPGEELPKYFRFALACLRHRRGWQVVEIGRDGGTAYRVVWKGWLTNGERNRLRRARLERNARKRAARLRS